MTRTAVTEDIRLDLLETRTFDCLVQTTHSLVQVAGSVSTHDAIS